MLTVSTPAVSVIIPTLNRPSELARAIESLLRQTLLPSEVIVIDQSRDDLSRREVDRLFGDAPQLAREAIKGVCVHDPRINGAAEARGRGMDLAHGDIWLFVDDDVVLEPDFLERLIEVHIRNPDAVGVSGVVTNYSPPGFIYRGWNLIFARGPFFDERQPVYWSAERLRDAEPIRVRMFTGAMMSFRASAIRGLRFDPNLTGGSLAEDADFTLRLSETGKVLLLAPSARLEHRRSDVGRAQDHWLRAHAQANYYLYYRHWKRSVQSRACFVWLNIGYALAVLFSCAKRRSSAPYASFAAGVRLARGLTHG